MIHRFIPAGGPVHWGVNRKDAAQFDNRSTTVGGGGVCEVS